MRQDCDVTFFVRRRVPAGFGSRLRVVAEVTLTDEGHTIETIKPLTSEELVEVAELILRIRDRAAAIEESSR